MDDLVFPQLFPEVAVDGGKRIIERTVRDSVVDRLPKDITECDNQLRIAVQFPQKDPPFLPKDHFGNTCGYSILCMKF